MTEQIQELKLSLLIRLQSKPAPIGPGESKPAQAALEAYFHNRPNDSEKLIRNCTTSFRQAFRKIVRYSPDLSSPKSQKKFTEFLRHLKFNPQFYKDFCGFIEEAEESGLHRHGAQWIADRIHWERRVHLSQYRYESIDSQLLPFYADYWTMDNPHVDFILSRRIGPRRRRKHRDFFAPDSPNSWD